MASSTIDQTEDIQKFITEFEHKRADKRAHKAIQKAMHRQGMQVLSTELNGERAARYAKMNPPES